MADNTDNETDEGTPEDSLVDALESIKSLLEKSDTKLAAARESISIASHQTTLNSIMMKEGSEQFEIPVLHDIVLPDEIEPDIESEIESEIEEDTYISEQILTEIDESLIDEPLDSDDEDMPTLPETEHEPQAILDYLDNLQKNIEKSLRNSLMKSVVTIESKVKKSISSEFNKIRKQIKKDLK